jgi:hypothetical protein
VAKHLATRSVLFTLSALLQFFKLAFHRTVLSGTTTAGDPGHVTIITASLILPVAGSASVRLASIQLLLREVVMKHPPPVLPPPSQALESFTWGTPRPSHSHSPLPSNVYLPLLILALSN